MSDKGLGISSADLPHIFEPFYRGAEALSRQIHGNGLGLSIVKGIVEAHDGHVTVHSTQGAGSTFVLHLPACQGEGSPIAQGTRHPAPQHSTCTGTHRTALAPAHQRSHCPASFSSKTNPAS